MKTDVVTAHDFRYPITKEQYRQVVFNDLIASGLVRRAHTIDLASIAEKVRR